jgi:preprotein translocase subunit SecD
MQRQRSLLALILVMVIAAIAVIASPGLRVPLGLDLQGGSQLTIQLKPTKDIPKITEGNLEDVLKVVELRINGLGVSEAVVQKVGNDKILVQLPGVKDPEQAERVLGGTAQLEFKRQKQGSETKFFELIGPHNQLKAQLKLALLAKDKAAIEKIKAEKQKNR